jgi:hypothetical protein
MDYIRNKNKYVISLDDEEKNLFKIRRTTIRIAKIFLIYVYFQRPIEFRKHIIFE